MQRPEETGGEGGGEGRGGKEAEVGGSVYVYAIYTVYVLREYVSSLSHLPYISLLTS
jgi:hypothetical protein